MTWRWIPGDDYIVTNDPTATSGADVDETRYCVFFMARKSDAEDLVAHLMTDDELMFAAYGARETSGKAAWVEYSTDEGGFCVFCDAAANGYDGTEVTAHAFDCPKARYDREVVRRGDGARLSVEQVARVFDIRGADLDALDALTRGDPVEWGRQVIAEQRRINATRDEAAPEC